MMVGDAKEWHGMEHELLGECMRNDLWGRGVEHD